MKARFRVAVKVPNSWHESKFILSDKTSVLQYSRDWSELSPASRLVSQLIADFYTRAIPQHAHGELLDLGCGKAPLLGYYSKFVRAATLVDWGNSLHSNPLPILHADINEQLPFADEEFDTIILSDVLEHIATPQNLLTEVNRILRNGSGVLLLNVPFFYPVHEAPYDFHRYTRYSLERMCQIAGFHLLELDEMGGVPEIFCDLTAKVLLHIPIIGHRLAALVQYVGGWLLKLKPVRHVSKRSAEHFPIGYTLVALKLPSCPVEL